MLLGCYCFPLGKTIVFGFVLVPLFPVVLFSDSNIAFTVQLSFDGCCCFQLGVQLGLS